MVELPRHRTANRVTTIADFDLFAFKRFRNLAGYRTIKLAHELYGALSAPFYVFDFNFLEAPLKDRRRSVKIAITATGEAYTVVFWFDLHMDDVINISSEPEGTPFH